MIKQFSHVFTSNPCKTEKSRQKSGLVLNKIGETDTSKPRNNSIAESDVGRLEAG